MTDLITDKLEEVDVIYDAYVDYLKVRTNKNDDIDRILNLQYKELATLNAEQCGEYAYALAQYGLYLQQEANYHKARHDWAELLIAYYVSAEDWTGQFLNKNDKMFIVCSKNKPLYKVVEMIKLSKTRLTSIEFLPTKIEQMVRALEELQRTKRSQGYKNVVL